MKNLINGVSFIALTVVRVFIFFKMSYLLYFTFFQPQNFKITEMGWFVCFMILDMWLLIVVKFTIPTKEEIDEEMNK
jgi:hypothetical protein